MNDRLTIRVTSFALAAVVTFSVLSGIDTLAQAEGSIEIDASGLVRIDGASADQLRAKLESLKQAGRDVELKNLSPLTRIFLIVRDFPAVAKLVARKA